MKFLSQLLGLSVSFVLIVQATSAALIGWQTFSNCGLNVETGICDATPDSNSTYDATPVGTVGSQGVYLSGVIGANASALGWSGRGQLTRNDILNGPGFGNESANSTRKIVNVPLANGLPGQRIGPFGSGVAGAPNGTSSWQFSESDVERRGDLRVTNDSDYYFLVRFIHFDARIGRADSPRNLQIKYLSGDGTAFDNGLKRLDTGNELVNLKSLYNNDFGPGPATYNVSHALGGVLNTAGYLAPGESAAFRFLWTGQTADSAQAQMDNIAIEGQFFLTEDLQVEVDPVVVVGTGITYYVSASVGDDANDGLTEATPFQTLARVNALMLEPGDQVLFKSGDAWQGMLWPKGSGTGGQPIVIGSYGGTVKPLIDGDGYQASLLIFNNDHYTISDLELTNQASHLDGSGQPKVAVGFGGAENDQGSGEDVRFGLKIVASDQSLSGFALSRLDIHDVYPTPANTSLQHQGYGIKFESQSNLAMGDVFTISDVLMENLTVSLTGHYGVWIRPLGLNGVDDYKHDDFTLRDSNFLNTGGAGFVIVKASNVLVENNLFDGTGSHLDSRMWQRGSGLWPFDSKDVVIQSNVLRNARGPLDSYGVHIDYNNEDVLVQYNYSYNNEGGFAQILGANENCGYRYNISVNDGYRVDGVDGAVQDGRIFNVSNFCSSGSGCSSTGNFLYNNTVYVPNTFSPDIVFKAGSGETLFHNNLIVVEEGSDVLQTDIASSGVIYDIEHNLFYPAPLFSLTSALTTDALYVDPQLRLPGADDPTMYKLQLTSPARLAGAFVPAGRDYFGFPVEAGVRPHIGAYNGNQVFGPIDVPVLAPLWRWLMVAVVGTTGLVSMRRGWMRGLAPGSTRGWVTKSDRRRV